MRRSEAVMELLAAFREGDSKRQLAVLRALAAISGTSFDRDDRSELAVMLASALAENKDSRVLTAGHLLLMRLNGSRPPHSDMTAQSGGSQARTGLAHFSPAKLVNRPTKVPPLTDGGKLYAFKIPRWNGSQPLLGIGARAALSRFFRAAAILISAAGVAAGSILLYAYNPLLADAAALLVIVAWLIVQSRAAKAGSRDDATAGARTPP